MVSFGLRLSRFPQQPTMTVATSGSFFFKFEIYSIQIAEFRVGSSQCLAGTEAHSFPRAHFIARRFSPTTSTFRILCHAPGNTNKTWTSSD
ncbi:hypothetical protein M404DRAFT_725019 [Pisolithus tinctorius Marx 270]|uniref:Uncharacterized protein n=1 Tax=Pisolithus tinctorius Marx 270 TaxID=870435 RepID=A0A0C3P2Q0_PISTI|nr:hypothetical protein M404DRAFT_725019 [Pisolithus tinctorius Marx 270]